MRTEDGYIIDKCLNGDPAAFGVLVDKYKGSIYALAYSKLGNFHDAEDITQEVFIKAYEKLRNLKQWDSFHAWLYSITSNLCKMLIRSRARRPDCKFIGDKDPASSTAAHREELARESLYDALDSLPEAYRQILTLHYLGGMEGVEIARFLGISHNTVRQRLSRARSQLREEMLAKMSAIFGIQKLQFDFTFRIVEAIKRMRIHPMPRITGLPWGLSLATGVIIAILGVGSHLNITHPVDSSAGSTLPSESGLMETGEIPIEALEIPQIPFTFGSQDNGDAGDPGFSEQQNAALMAPRGEGFKIPEKPSVRLGKGKVLWVTYSPDGKILAVGSGIGTWLYDADNLNEIALLEGGHVARTVAFSPDGKSLASGSWDGTVQLWDIDNKKQLAMYEHSDDVYSVAFSPDGKIMASASWDNTIRLWDMDNQKQLAILQQQGAVYPETLAFSPDGKMLASGNYDKTIRLWDIQSQKQVASLAGHTGRVWSVAYSPDGKLLASGSEDNTIRLWDIESTKEIAVLKGHSDWVWSVMFNHDGNLLASGSLDGKVMLWDVREQKNVAVLQGDAGCLLSIGFSPDGKVLAACGIGGATGETVWLWSVAEQKQIGIIEHTGGGSIALSPDGKTIARYDVDKAIRLWDLDSQKQTGVLKGHTDTVLSAAFSPDGKYIASSGNDRTVRLWDMQKQLAVFSGHISPVGSVAFSPDGKIIASGGFDRTVRLWDVDKQKQIAILQGHSEWVRSVAFSPDGKLLASGGEDKNILFWDVDKHVQVGTLKGHAKGILSVAFSPDGKTIASGGYEGTVYLWDVAGQKQIASLQGHSNYVWAVAFSPDGKLLASGGNESNIRLWDVEQKKQLATLEGFASGIRSLYFNLDGKWLASSSGGGVVLLWEMNIPVPGKAVESTGKLPGTWGEVKKTALLQNFPNPFNPETWIPFSLSEPEHVIIKIYSSKGGLVRVLDLGQKPSGAYLSKENAAYWDGRNENGEPVASDVYFCVMEAGESVNSKKIVMVR